MKIKLNLIPQYKKEELIRAARLRTILRWQTEIGFILAIFLALLVSLNYILQFDLTAATMPINSQSKEKQDKLVQFAAEFKAVNVEASLDENIQKDQLYWSRLYIKLSSLAPDGISMAKMANKDYKVFLAGTADTRDTLMNFKDNLSKDDCFSDINLPLSDLVLQNNVDFQMDFNVKESCVKNK